MVATTELVALDALGPAGVYRARDRFTISDLAGTQVAELSLVPKLFVTRAMAALHKADTPPSDERQTPESGTLINTSSVLPEATVRTSSFQVAALIGGNGTASGVQE